MFDTSILADGFNPVKIHREILPAYCGPAGGAVFGFFQASRQ
jgi:hypothetical protein